MPYNPVYPLCKYGEIPQYYVEESHPPIIDKEIWEAVQLEMERRKTFASRHQIQKIDYATDNHPFAGRVICGCCKRAYGRKVWNSTDERLRRVIWRCNSKYRVKGKIDCGSRHIDDRVLYQAFINTFNALVENKDYFIEKLEGQLKNEDVLRKVIFIKVQYILDENLVDFQGFRHFQKI